MRFTLLHSTARLRLPAVSAAAIGALGCATALAQAAPSISATAFTNDVSEMAKLKSLVSQSKGKIGVLSARDNHVRALHILRRALSQRGVRQGGAARRRRHHHQCAGQRIERADPGAIGDHPGRDECC